MKYITGILLTLLLVTGCSKNIGTENDKQFNTSPTFSVPVTLGDGTKGEYILIGQKNKVAFQVGSGPIGKAEVLKIVEGKKDKYMWYFWGSEDKLQGKLNVKGIHESGYIDTIFTSSINVGSGMNGADGTMPSNMKFSKSGKWKLDVYIGKNVVGTIVIDVVSLVK